MATKGKFDGRLGTALSKLAELGELRVAKATRNAWAVPAASHVRTLAATKFTPESLREHNIPEWAITAIMRERSQRFLRGVRSA